MDLVDPSSPTVAIRPPADILPDPSIRHASHPDTPASELLTRVPQSSSLVFTGVDQSMTRTNPFKIDLNIIPRRASSSANFIVSSPSIPLPHSKPTISLEPQNLSIISNDTAPSDDLRQPKDSLDENGSPGLVNPFLQRAKTHTGVTSTSTRVTGRIPPLPPHKPKHISSPSISTSSQPPMLHMAPKHLSTSSVQPTHCPENLAPITDTNMSNSSLPVHVVTPLMQQSLAASKFGQTLKRAQAQAEGERVMEVIRSSSILTPRTGRSPTKASAVASSQEAVSSRRPVPSPPRSQYSNATTFSTGSNGSFDQVASARLGTRSAALDPSPSSSQERLTSWSMPHTAPPTHPDLRRQHQRSPSYHSASTLSSYSNKPFHSPSTNPTLNESTKMGTSLTRTTRSRSMNQPSPTSTLFPSEVVTETDKNTQTGRASPPLPPPRRRRPESIQLLTTSKSKDSSEPDVQSPFGSAFTNALDRDREREKMRERENSKSSLPSLSALQRTLSQLHSRAQPTLDRARFKAEAGLSRRGFVPNGASAGADSLMRSQEGVSAIGDGDEYAYNHTSDGGGIGSDFERLGSDSGQEDENGHERMKSAIFKDRDDLKLPDGEGWTRL